MSDADAASPAPPVERPPSRSGFRARRSRLDLEVIDEHQKEFSGFFNLFISFLLYYSLVTLYPYYRDGRLMELSLLELMSKDLLVLGLCDAVLVLYTFTAFLLVKLQVATHWGVVPLTALQHTLQSGLFALATSFVYYRDWPWPQSGSLMLHTIVLFMKMHSYARTNQELRQDAHPLYPSNVSLGNFIDFMLVPTLVYEPDYPRTDSVRIAFLVEKAAGFVGAATLLYIDITHYMYPVLDRLAEYTTFESIMLLVFPFMLAYLLVFYLIFESLSNFMAEATRFADREFYADWWNSTNFDEFSRKWNKPVHDWLLRHVYLESMKTYRVSRTNATVATFVFSLLLHELALTVTGRRFRPYIFVLAMLQLVVIPLLRHPLFRGKRLGNIFVWLGMLWGLPMLCVLYAREHYNLPPPDIQVVGFFFVVCGTFLLFAFIARVLFNFVVRSTRAAAVKKSAAAEATSEATGEATSEATSEAAVSEAAVSEAAVSEAEQPTTPIKRSGGRGEKVEEKEKAEEEMEVEIVTPRRSTRRRTARA